MYSRVNILQKVHRNNNAKSVFVRRHCFGESRRGCRIRIIGCGRRRETIWNRYDLQKMLTDCARAVQHFVFIDVLFDAMTSRVF